MTKRLELTGKMFGRWKVIEFAYLSKHNKTQWLCECQCDLKTKRIIDGGRLKKGGSKSCGCISKENGIKRRKDYSGQIINGTLILKRSKGKDNRTYYICECNKCGNEFERAIHTLRHTKKSTCGKCNLLKNDFPELLEEWDYEKNKELDINEITSYTHKKVWWKCKNCGHGWRTVVKNRTLNKTGCPICWESNGEKETVRILTKLNIKFEREKRLDDCRDKNPLPFDFYLPDYNTYIEFQGYQHYNPMKSLKDSEEKFLGVKRRDEIKKEYCYRNGLKLIVIPYWHIDNIEKIIKKELNINNE